MCVGRRSRCAVRTWRPRPRSGSLEKVGPQQTSQPTASGPALLTSETAALAARRRCQSEGPALCGPRRLFIFIMTTVDCTVRWGAAEALCVTIEFNVALRAWTVGVCARNDRD